MIELKNDVLQFHFPDVHPGAGLTIAFMRTLRIPDDDRVYPLPPGFRRFPLRHIDDYAHKLPQSWIEHGGIMLPMYQAEALWILFLGHFLPDHGTEYPLAIRVATGKVDALTGKTWQPGLAREPQNYLVYPDQPWLDGYVVERGIIRQFVAMPLGAGYSVEEQVTGKAEHGGLQLQVLPMRRDVFERRFPLRPAPREYLGDGYTGSGVSRLSRTTGMGLAPGGRMRQEVYLDKFDLADWDTGQTSRCFVHLANSMVWRSITGTEPPTTPLTAAEYTRAGLPWFDYYDERRIATVGSPILRGLKSLFQIGMEKRQVPLPENEQVTPATVVTYRRGDRVRESEF